MLGRPGGLGMAVAVWLIAACSGDAAASEADHEVARAALERGEVLPLRSILERVGREYPGQVVEVELEREHGRWIYEIRVLREGGALLKLEVDGRDGRVLGAKERAASRAGAEGKR